MHGNLNSKRNEIVETLEALRWDAGDNGTRDVSEEPSTLR